MVWSLVKILIFIVLVAALTFGAGWVIEAGGEVRVSLGATEFSLTPLAGAIALVLLLVAGWIAFRLAGLLVAVIRFINGDETAISRYFDRNRERRGFEALADALMALASGEGRLAMTKAARAERYLGRPDLTVLLSAQAAEMTGETKKAQDYYKRLLADDRTRFVGVQGILKQKLAEGDTATALKLAERAFALKPKHEKTLDTLFALQSDKADWKGARATLAAKLKARALPKDVHTRRDAVLALAEAREKIEAGDLPGGSAAAFEANRLSPDLIPAAVLAAEMHVVNDAPKKAVTALKKAWGAQPHPDLAAAFAEIVPDETPEDRRTRFQPLLKLKPDDPESRMLAAELAIVAEDFPAARKAMGDLADTAPSTRALTIMAAIERGEGSPDKVVRGFLARALSASRGPQWICTGCKHIHAAWVPVCEHCGSFDTLAWEVPPASAETPSRSADMLPLIVGALEDRRDTDADAPDPEPLDQPDETPAPARKDFATRVSDVSDDMDGILGDPHTVPDKPAP
jgi:HemY protein